jgi:uncharacterized protein (TIGR02246 family)
MRPHLSLAAGVLALALCACDQAATPEAQAGASVAADAEAVKQLETRFLTGWEAKDPAVKALYAPNATMVVPNTAPRQDPQSIAEAFDNHARDPAATFDATNATTVISGGGDLAFSQGTYTESHTNAETGAIERTNGYYLVVYKKQADGSWKVVQDVSSPLP